MRLYQLINIVIFSFLTITDNYQILLFIYRIDIV